MATLTILEYPDPRLKEKASPVTQFDEQLKTWVQDMFETMYARKGVGLASTQVGIPYRFFVMDCSEDKKGALCLINPEILETTGDVLEDEGCLSFPGVYAKVKRAKEVKVRYCDVEGQVHEKTMTDLEGRCIQHELDHLNGITFVDHLSPLKRQIVLKKLKKRQEVAS